MRFILLAVLLSSCCTTITSRIERLDQKAVRRGCVSHDRKDTTFYPIIVYRDTGSFDTTGMHQTLKVILSNFMPVSETTTAKDEIVRRVFDKLSTDTSRFDTLGIHCEAFVHDSKLHHNFHTDDKALPKTITNERVYEDKAFDWRLFISIVLNIIFVGIIIKMKI